MKAVIIDIKKGRAVALIQNFGVITIKNKGYSLGEQIVLPEKSFNTQAFRSKFRKVAVVFAIILITVMIGLFSFNYYSDNIQTSYTVSIGINPEVEISVTNNYKVRKIVPKNEDASNMDLSDMKSLSVEEALKKYLKLCKNKGYLNNGSTININIEKNKKDTDITKISSDINHHINTELEEQDISATVRIHSNDNEKQEKEDTQDKKSNDKQNSDSEDEDNTIDKDTDEKDNTKDKEDKDTDEKDSTTDKEDKDTDEKDSTKDKRR